jgi:hypothetical protein
MTKRFEQSLLKVKERLAENLETGIQVAALTLQAEAQALCPVDTGALRASAFTRRDNQNDPDMIQYTIGFTQFYGIYVHEMPGPFKVGQPKFLEEPARKMIREFGGIIKSNFKSS